METIALADIRPGSDDYLRMSHMDKVRYALIIYNRLIAIDGRTFAASQRKVILDTVFDRVEYKLDYPPVVFPEGYCGSKTAPYDPAFDPSTPEYQRAYAAWNI